MDNIIQADQGDNLYDVTVTYSVTHHFEVDYVVRGSTALAAESGGYTATRRDVPQAFAMSAVVAKRTEQVTQVPHVVLEAGEDGSPKRVAFAMTPVVDGGAICSDVTS